MNERVEKKGSVFAQDGVLRSSFISFSAAERWQITHVPLISHKIKVSCSNKEIKIRSWLLTIKMIFSKALTEQFGEMINELIHFSHVEPNSR